MSSPGRPGAGALSQRPTTLFYCNKCGGHCKVYYNPRKGLEVCGRASRSRCANTSSLVPRP